MTFLELKCKFYLVVFRSPGVIITEIHKRGGMDDEEYSKVSVSEEKVTRSLLASSRCSVSRGAARETSLEKKKRGEKKH